MKRYLWIALAMLGVALQTLPAAAQGRNIGLISSEAARRNGLELAWHTHAQVNRSNGRVTNITQYVGEWVYYEVKLGKLTWRFSERDRTPEGDMLGRDGAQALANAKMKDLTDSHLSPTLETHVKADVRLYVVTDHGLLQAINGETGETLWAQQVGNPTYPTTAAGANEMYVAVCNGSTIYCYDRRNGDLVWTREARYTVVAGPAVTDSIVSVPTIRGVIESYRIDQTKRSLPHIYKSQGYVSMQPMSTPRSVAWGTETGNMYVSDAASGRGRFRLETNSTIVGPPAYLAPGYLYAATLDGYIYCSDEIKGNMLWRYSTGDSISQSPMAVGDTVYVVTNEGHLHAIDYLSGMLKEIKTTTDPDAAPAAPSAAAPPAAAPPAAAKASPSQVRRWPIVSGVKSIVSVSPTRIYCLGRPGQLLVIDNNTGSVLGTMQIGSADVVLHNQATDRLILGTSSGLLQCLHEIKLTEPYVHSFEREKLQAKNREVVQDAGDAAEDAPMEAMPANDDPFGNKPMADPFGGAPENDPFGEAPKKGGGAPPPTPANDDPFGSPPPKSSPPPAAENDPFG